MGLRITQGDLFQQPQWLNTVIRRLPATDFLSVMDVALAFGVSQSKVAEWIDEGRIEAADMNAGTCKRVFWRIPRASVVALATAIARGL